MSIRQPYDNTGRCNVIKEIFIRQDRGAGETNPASFFDWRMFLTFEGVILDSKYYIICSFKRLTKTNKCFIL